MVDLSKFVEVVFNEPDDFPTYQKTIFKDEMLLLNY